MKTLKTTLIALFVGATFLTSCSKDDDNPIPTGPVTTDLKYSNGNLSTGDKTSTAISAPAGYTWSEVQKGNINWGYGISEGWFLADDFVVPAGEKWSVNKIIFYVYATGHKDATSPVNDVRYEIFNVNPSTAGATKLFGNSDVNKFVSGEDVKMYRISNGATTSLDARKIFKITTSATDITLTAGTYWIKWQSKILSLPHYYPSNTDIGKAGLSTYNALSFNGSAWSPLKGDDAGTVGVDFPFEIIGTKTK